MNYEKLYKEALERAKNIRFGDPSSATANVVCESIFPELKESEDEKIKEGLIKYLKADMECNPSQSESFYNKSIAWLEKQGEQKPKFRIGDTIKKKSTRDIVTVNEVDLKNKEYRLSNTGFIPFKYEHLWELVEQNPAWSEEDEKMMQCIHKYVRASASNLDFQNVKMWLKSLKDRVQPKWKPTEEQIRALSMAYKDSLTSGENLITQTETLKSLYNDLKKL